MPQQASGQLQLLTEATAAPVLGAKPCRLAVQAALQHVPCRCCNRSHANPPEVAASTVPLCERFVQGYNDGKDIAHDLLPQAQGWGAAAVTLHGRTRQQRCASHGQVFGCMFGDLPARSQLTASMQAVAGAAGIAPAAPLTLLST
jgi:hypothetical protein